MLKLYWITKLLVSLDDGPVLSLSKLEMEMGRRRVQRTAPAR